MANTYGGNLTTLWTILFGAGVLGTLKPQFNHQKGLSQGTGNWQFNKLYIAERTVVTGTPDVLNLTDGSLKDPAGIANVFTKVIAWGVINEDAVNHLTIGANATNPWEAWTSAGGLKHVRADSHFADTARDGYAVGAGASDRIKVVADAGTITYAIAILGQG